MSQWEGVSSARRLPHGLHCTCGDSLGEIVDLRDLTGGVAEATYFERVEISEQYK